MKSPTKVILALGLGILGLVALSAKPSSAATSAKRRLGDEVQLGDEIIATREGIGVLSPGIPNDAIQMVYRVTQLDPGADLIEGNEIGFVRSATPTIMEAISPSPIAARVPRSKVVGIIRGGVRIA